MPNDATLKFEPLAVRRKSAAALIGELTTKIDELLALGLLDGRKSGKNLLITMVSIRGYIEGLPKASLALPRRLRRDAGPLP